MSRMRHRRGVKLVADERRSQNAAVRSVFVPQSRIGLSETVIHLAGCHRSVAVGAKMLRKRDRAGNVIDIGAEIVVNAGGFGTPAGQHGGP